MRILTVNAGSTSVKLERYELSEPLAAIARPPRPSFSGDESGLSSALRAPLDAVAHRLVQLPSGTPPVTRLDAEGLGRIRSSSADDRLHDAPALRIVEQIARELPELSQFAVSDSAFHRTMGPAAVTYALPQTVAGTELHRIGYHGLSHEYAAHRACLLAGIDVTNARVITAHLGGGSSLCAVQNGSSIDTTMGYTPFEGLPMATRSGSVDPGILLHLLRRGMSVSELEETLTRKGGLLGISGLSGDTRDLIAAAANPNAQLALEVLAWRLRAAIGAMIGTLGGVDLIVFTGGIGEHTPSVREAALQGGLGLRIALDGNLNVAVTEGLIGVPGRVAVAVVAAREGWQMARFVNAAAASR